MATFSPEVLAHMEALESRLRDETPAVVRATDTPEEVKAKPKKKALSVTSSTGEIPLSTFNPNAPADLSFTIRGDDAFDECVRFLIPAKKDHNGYYFPVEFLLAAYEQLEHNISMRMFGPPGCGKSTLLAVLASILRIPYVEVVGDREKDGGDLIGRVHAREGSTVYVEGPLVMVFEYGGIVFYDEWAKTLPAHNAWIHPVADDRRVLDIPEHTDVHRRRIQLHDQAMLVLADNTAGAGDGIGMYSSLVQDLATLDRFDTTVSMEYPPENVEANLLMDRTGIDKDCARRICKLGTQLRKAWTEGKVTTPWTVRRSLASAKKFALTDGHAKHGLRILEQTYVANLPDEVEKQTAVQLISNVYGR